MQKVPYVLPIVGGLKIEQLHLNIETLGIALTKDILTSLKAWSFRLGILLQRLCGYHPLSLLT